MDAASFDCSAHFAETDTSFLGDECTGIVRRTRRLCFFDWQTNIFRYTSQQCRETSNVAARYHNMCSPLRAIFAVGRGHYASSSSAETWLVDV